MNHIYKLVWNALHQAWVAVSEVASGIGSRSSKTTTDQRRGPTTAPVRFTLKTIAACAGGMCAGAVFLLNPGQVSAQTLAPTTLPQGGVVTQGAATLQGAGSSSAPVLNVNQTSQRAVVNWNSFNLGSAATVNFNQPNAQSATLNRVLDMNPSQIFGHINAPGQVTLVNPAGVYFSPSAVLDVGALTATTLGQTDADFMAGKASFQRNGSTGSVVNEGTLKAVDTIALLAPEVRNQGTITASAVVMAAGESIQLNFDAFSRLASLSVTPSQIKALVENKTAILAPGGLIILSATALRGLQASVIHSGQIDASSLSTKGGRIVLEGDNIQLSNGSRLNASGATGGGTVLVGGDWQGSGTMAQATTVAMAQGATIDASATQSGDGGRVVLWSDVGNANSSTTVNGSIAARGGALGGNGGQVETSGHTVDSSGARINAGADQGSGGLWLIDPADATITQTIADSYRDTLNTGTSVLNDVSGSITWNSGITLSKTGGAAATLTLRTTNNGSITLNNASITSTSNPLNLVLWTRYNDEGRSGFIFLNGGNISTNGGNVSLSGGIEDPTLWHGLSVGGAYANTYASGGHGINLTGTTINTGTGNIQIKGQSYYTGGSAATGNYGVVIAGGSTLTTTSGTIDLVGDLKGTYTNGSGVVIGSATATGNVTIASDGGAINITGTGADQSGSGTGFRHAVLLKSDNSDQVAIKSTSGAITLNGAASFSASNFTNNDSSGLQLQANTTTSGIQVVSQTGAINLLGSNALEATAQNVNGIRFTAADVANSIRIGYDGSSAYSGNILVQSNSIEQLNNNTGVGSLSVQSTGTLTVQSAGNAFTYLRAGSSGTLTFDNDWNFGTGLSAFTLGKSTNTLDLTLSNALTTAGPISLYGGNLYLTAALNTTAGGANGDVLAKATGSIKATANLSTNGGDVVLWADSDANNVGSVWLDNNSIATKGGSLWAGGGAAGGSFNGLAVGSGYATSSTNSLSNEGVVLHTTTIDTTNGAAVGGSVMLKGKNDRFNGTETRFGVLIDNSSNISTGVGSITVDGTMTALQPTSNYPSLRGVSIDTATLQATTGDITITGSRQGYNQNATGVFIRNATVQTTGATGGNISITGTQGDTDSGNYTGPLSQNGIFSEADGASALTMIKTNGGNILLNGTNKSANSANSAGLLLYTVQPTNVDATNPTIKIVSATGNVTLKGDNPNNTAVGSYGVQLNAANYGKVYIGFDGTTAYSGNTDIQGRSFVQQNFGAGYLFLQGSGALTIEPLASSNASFVTGASTPVAINFDTTYNFGSSHSSVNLGGVAGNTGSTADTTVSNALTAAGPISVYGGNINLNANLTSTLSGAAILAKASGNISSNASRSFQTNNGNLVFWSNASNGGTAGAQTFGDSNTFNTANGATSQDTGGGKIVMAGGLDDGSNGGTAGDGVPDGFASSSSASGISLGTGTAGTTSMYSGGGNILLRGNSTGSGLLGIQWNKVGTVVAGNGTVSLAGTATQGHGIELGASSGSTSITAGGGDATHAAISIVGTTTSTTSFGIQGNGGSMQAKGDGGITVTGTTNASSTAQGTNLGMDALAKSGPIAITAIGGTGLRYGGTLGKKAATGVLASSSNVTLTGDVVTVNTGIAVDTTGTLTVQPYSTSFTSALSWPLANFTVANVTGLTLGKLGNLADITVTSDQSINGPISIYGGNVALNASLAATASGAMVKVLASGDITLAASKTVTTQNGAVLFNSDADGNGAGAIVLGSGSGITSNNGNITLGGGSAGAGNAIGNSTNTAGIAIGGTLNVGTGALVARGQGYAGASTNYGIALNAATVTASGAGTIDLTGTGGAGTGTDNKGIYGNGTLTGGSTGALTLTGTGGAAAGGNNYGIGLGSTTVIGSGGGNVNLIGTGGGGNGSSGSNDGIYLFGTSINSGVNAGIGGVVNVTGTSGQTTGSYNNGVQLASSTTINSAGGTNVTGFGRGSGTGGINYGVDLEATSVITGTGSAAVVVTGSSVGGTGGGNFGVALQNASSIGSGGGTINVNGTGNLVSGGLGVYMGNTAKIASGGNAAVTVTTDSITVGGNGISAGTGTVTVQNSTAGTKIDLGGADVLTGSPLTLGLDSAELNLITAGTLVVGRNVGTAAGAMTVSSTLAPTGVANLVLKTGSTLAINAPITVNNTLTLSALGNVSQAVGGNIAATNLLLNGSGNYALATASSNAISTLAASLTGAISYKNSSALQIGTVDGVNGIISAGGPVSIGTANGDLTVARNVATLDASSNAVLLNAGIASAVGTSTGGNIVLGSSPAVTITTGIGGRTTLMTGAVGGSTGVTGFVVAGSGRFRYNSDESATNYTTALGSGAYAIYREAPTVHLSTGNVGITYGDALPSFSSTVTGAVNSDVVGATVAVGGAQSSSLNYTAGSHSLTPGSAAATALGYAIGTVTGGTLSVAQKTLTSSFTGTNRTYNGTTTAAVTATPSGIVSGDLVAVVNTGANFANKNVGIGKAIAITGVSLSSADKDNYTIASTGSASANVQAADVSFTTSAVSRGYNGALGAAGTATVASGTVFSGDTFSGGTFAFTDKNVGTGKTVTTSGVTVTDGNGGGNYNISYANNTASSIGQANITLATSAVNKVYDSGVGALGTAIVTSGPLFSGDSLSGGTFAFTDKNVGTGKTVTTSGVTVGDGVNNSNYAISYANNTASTITKANLAVGGITANNKTYDATTSATLSGTATISALGSDVVALGGSGSGSFADKNVGTGKAVTTTGYSLSGSDAGNYTLLQPTGLSANITKADLAVGGITANNKTYDATTSATLSGTATVSALGSDVVALGGSGSGSGSFADKNVGTGKAVIVSGYSMAGADAGNYTLVQPTGLTANITKADLAVSGITANNKTYDATTSATLSGTATISALGSDVVALGGSGSGSFADKNVGTGKAVTTTGYSLSGSDAGNYTLVQPTGLSANITKADLAVGGITANNKTYDATTSATLSGTATVSALGSDVVALGGSGSGSFADKNVGTGKAVTTTGYSLSGADAGNYTLLQPTGLSANITKADLAVSGITANNKTYDATTSATLSGTATISALGSDVVALGGSGSGSFADKNVGTGKAVIVSGYSMAGADAGNYTLVQPTGLSANITKADLAVSGITANNKTYDATTSATLSGTATVSALGSDVVALGGSGSGSFADKNVGTGKAVTTTGYSLSGSDAGNYTLVQPTGLSANITKADLAVGGITANNKTYDATTSATLSGTATVSALGSDVVALGGSGSGSFADKNVGTGKAVTTTGYSLSGADAGNYNLLQPTGLTANITKATVTVSGITADNKTYDGSTSATVRSAGAVYTGLVTGETLSTVGSGTFSDKNAATGKTVILSGTTTATGTTSLSNYDVTEQATTTADITPAALTVTAPLASKTYDGNTNATGSATVGSLAGGAAGEHVGLAATVAYTDKNAGAGTKTTRAAGLTVVDSSGTDVTANYAVNYVDNTGSTITPAALTVTANADARFVTQTDAVGYYGAHYDGLVGGETSSVLGGSLAITRSNVGTGAAGTYTGTLVPSGLTSGNYSIRYAPGTYTIVPANELLVRVANTSTVYGSTPTLAITSVEYLDSNSSTIHTLAGTSVGSSFSYTDGVGGSIQFSLSPVAAPTSTAGHTVVGNYALADAAPTVVGSNFVGNPVFVGNLNVAQKPVTASASGVGKTYNGSTDMLGISLDLAGQETGDQLRANGSGAFADKNVGSNRAYLVQNMALAGSDAGNYYLTGSNSLVGSNGSITPAAITLRTTDVVKTYDGNTSAAGTLVVAAGTLFGGDTLSGGTFAFDDKNVGTGKTVTTSGVTVGDGVNNSNYTVSYADNTGSSITRLNSVTWVGGPTGNWFDPANWAGGAVPDLANVANVILPAGVTANFGTTVVAPAQAGPVQVDSLGSQGSLNVSGGALDVGTGGITLAGLTQSGGTITNAGDTTLGSFNQSGGSATVAGNFSTTDQFTQTGGGTLAVGGTTQIDSTQGDVVLGNLVATGPLTITNTGGGIGQTPGTSLVAQSNSSFSASNGGSPADISLTNPGNDFQGTVSVTGGNVALVDANGLTLGTVTTTGNLDLTSHGPLDLGTSTVGGNLNANSNNGSITQSGPAVVAGTTGLNAGTGNIALTHPGNDFQGTASANGGNVALVDTNGLTLGTVTTTGNLELTSHGPLDLGTSTVGGNLGANSNNGNITQSGPLTVNGNAVLAAGTGSIVLIRPGNRVGGTVVATGSPVSVTGEGTAVEQFVPMATLVPEGNPLTVQVSARAVPGSTLEIPTNAATVVTQEASAQGAAGVANSQKQATDGFVRVTPVRDVSAQMPGLVLVQVSGLALRSGTFQAALPEQVGQALRSLAGNAVAMLPGGQPLPAWLQFDPQTLVFTAQAVPANALPLTVLVRSGSYQVEVEITEIP